MRRASLFVIAAIFAGALVGCSKGNFSERASEGKSNTFRYPITSEITSLDPAKVQDGDTITVPQRLINF